MKKFKTFILSLSLVSSVFNAQVVLEALEPVPYTYKNTYEGTYRVLPSEGCTGRYYNRNGYTASSRKEITVTSWESYDDAKGKADQEWDKYIKDLDGKYSADCGYYSSIDRWVVATFTSIEKISDTRISGVGTCRMSPQNRTGYITYNHSNTYVSRCPSSNSGWTYDSYNGHQGPDSGKYLGSIDEYCNYDGVGYRYKGYETQVEICS